MGEDEMIDENFKNLLVGTDGTVKGAWVRITGYFDFPTRSTDRIGRFKSCNSEAITLDEEDGTRIKILGWDKILGIGVEKKLRE